MKSSGLCNTFKTSMIAGRLFDYKKYPTRNVICMGVDPGGDGVSPPIFEVGGWPVLSSPPIFHGQIKEIIVHYVQSQRYCLEDLITLPSKVKHYLKYTQIC